MSFPMVFRRSALLALLLAMPAPWRPDSTAALHAQEPGSPSSATVPLYDNLGNHRYGISTDVPLAQQYFDQGLRLYYAFNHAEAIRSFNEAARLDPDCAMCHWGTALAHGPNINLPMDADAGREAYAAIRKAVERERHASAKERALIRALATRYVADPSAERAGLDSAYARAMEVVVQAYPDDLEAATLYAESLMNLSPWHYWTREGEPRPDTPGLLEQLERVIQRNPNHPGANHFYIHAVEEVHPERAVPMAERLAALMPGAGHLVHMPGHIYIRVGRYMDAIRANEHAIHADETFIRDTRPGAGVYTLGYYPHNYDFLAFAASMVGRSEQAIDAARKVSALVPEEMLGAPGMDFLQHHLTRPLQLLVRFGRWREILESPAPPEHLTHARAMWHYARGRALSAQGDVTAAEAELDRLRAAAENPALSGMQLEFNTAARVVAIATHVLAGRIAGTKSDQVQAVSHLREAVHQEDDLVYGEPPEWTVPVRHDLGEVLLAAGRAEESERVYREDLQRFPENGWSLHGLMQSLRAQGRHAEADRVEDQLRRAWGEADVPVGDRGQLESSASNAADLRRSR